MSERRDDDWLLESVRALDRVFFLDELHDVVTGAKFVRFRKTKTFVYAKWRAPVVEVNAVLAQPWVPDEVVLACAYHEMCHAKFGHDHGAAFLLAEMRFPYFAASEVWCAEHLAKLLAAKP